MTLKILLVEDSAPDRTLFKYAASQSGIALELAYHEDGLDALEYLLNIPDTSLPHIVITDIQMPKVTGIQLTHAIKKDARLARLPVVVHSTSCSEEDIQNAYMAGANGYYEKKLNLESYISGIQELLIHWHGKINLS